jgi:glutaconate CoA-transferase subunit A
MRYASGAGLPIGSGRDRVRARLLRQKRRDLHTIFHCNSQQLNLLAGAGAATKAECGFSGLEVFGFANGLRRAVESGQLALEDYSNLAMPLRLLGGALNWPFMPATVNIGSDLQDRSGFAPDEYPATSKIATVTDPFRRRQIGAFRPLAGPCGHPRDAGRSARHDHARHGSGAGRAVARRQARVSRRRHR